MVKGYEEEVLRRLKEGVKCSMEASIGNCIPLRGDPICGMCIAQSIKEREEKKDVLEQSTKI